MAKKKEKPVSGLMAGLVKAGFISPSDARQIKREQKEEKKQIIKEQGYEGVIAAEAAKLQELERLAAEKRRETQLAAEAQQAEARVEKIAQLTRDRLHAGGNRRYYFVRKDKVVDFVDVDDGTQRLLGDGQAAIIWGDSGRPGDYWIMALNSKLHELRQLAPELILHPPA